MQHALFQKKHWGAIAFTFLLITAALGVLLRLMLFVNTGWNYGNILHAHSHIATLGWCNNVLFIMLVNYFMPVGRTTAYRPIFWLFQLAVVGMLIAFPIQGYAPVSIAFSSFFILVTYYFSYRIMTDVKKEKQFAEHPGISVTFLKAGILFLLLSSFGPWALGPLMVSGLGGTEWYYNAIYFYLHFLYNGWFIFALFALFFRWLEQKKIAFDQQLTRPFFRFLFSSCILGYSLSVLWANPPAWVFILGGVSGILQLIALFYFAKLLKSISKTSLTIKESWLNVLIRTALVSFTVKIILQALSAIPTVALMAGEYRDFVIAYLHLVFLGFLTPVFIVMFFKQGSSKRLSTMGKTGVVLYIIGFTSNELLLFLSGVSQSLERIIIPNSYQLMTVATTFLLLGVLFLFIHYLSIRSVDSH